MLVKGCVPPVQPDWPESGRPRGTQNWLLSDSHSRVLPGSWTEKRSRSKPLNGTKCVYANYSFAQASRACCDRASPRRPSGSSWPIFFFRSPCTYTVNWYRGTARVVVKWIIYGWQCFIYFIFIFNWSPFSCASSVGWLAGWDRPWGIRWPTRPRPLPSVLIYVAFPWRLPSRLWGLSSSRGKSIISCASVYNFARFSLRYRVLGISRSRSVSPGAQAGFPFLGVKQVGRRRCRLSIVMQLVGCFYFGSEFFFCSRWSIPGIFETRCISWKDSIRLCKWANEGNWDDSAFAVW